MFGMAPFAMGSKQNRYAPAFRRKIVELVRAGRKPCEFSRVWSQTVVNCAVGQAEGTMRVDAMAGLRPPTSGLNLAGRDVRTAAQRGARAPLKSRGLVCKRELCEAEGLFGFVKLNQVIYPVRVMCRVLKISVVGSNCGFGRWSHLRTELVLLAINMALAQRQRGGRYL
jgi:hypothetical protein